MSNGTPSGLPCVTLPPLQQFSVSLPLGGSISALADFSLGTPNNCTMTFNLLMQVTPVLASITCLVKILGVVAALKELPNPVPILAAIEQVAECLAAVAVPAIPFGLCIIDILKLIVSFLTCFVDELTSIATFQASIDIGAAQGDPDLTAALTCAQQNATTSMANLSAGIQGLQPLISLVGTLAGIAGLNISVAITPPPAGADALAAVAHLKATVDNLNQIVQSIPS